MKKLLMAILATLTALWYIRPKMATPCKYVQQTDELEHTEGGECWCNPTLFFDGGSEFGNVWVHKGMGEELPPARILIEAVADAMRNG